MNDIVNSVSASNAAELHVAVTGNVCLKGAAPSKFATEPLQKPDFDCALQLTENPVGWDAASVVVRRKNGE